MNKKNLFRRTLMVLAAFLLCFTKASAQEAYVVKSTDNTTLTFYYDNLKSSRTGTTYSLNTGNNDPSWIADGSYENVTTVVFDASFDAARPTTTFSWFAGMNNLTNIVGIEYLHTENVTTMWSMFNGCQILESLDVSHFNTANVTNMGSMFSGCNAVESLDVSHFNTANVINMASMFSHCSALSQINLANFDTGNVTLMSNMFYGCSSLTSLNLSGFNTSNVTAMNSMFNGCSSLTTIWVGNAWTTNAVTNSRSMFAGCTNLVGGMGTTWNIENPTDMTYARIDGGSSNPGYLTDIRSPYVVKSTDNTMLTFYYDNLKSSRTGTIYSLNTGYASPDWTNDGSYQYVTTVVFDASFANARPTSTCSWFYGMGELSTITGIEYLNTSEVTTMMSMFVGCRNLMSLNLTGFDTSNVTDMREMFRGCEILTSLDLSYFNTRNVDFMSNMFDGCKNLKTLDLSSFNTSNVTDMSFMFYNCWSLTSLNLSSFDTSNVTDMDIMFNKCLNLEILDLSSFNTASLGMAIGMFDGCEKLKTICVGDGWTTDEVTNSDSMFNGCTSLVGGQGTVYDADHVDMTYARIDGGERTPGYLTDIHDPYVVRSTDGTTLTFYHDGKRGSKTGTTYNLNIGNNNPAWYADGSYANVTTVVFDASFANARPTSTKSWFDRMGNLTTITGIENLNTSEVTTMNRMFSLCGNLTSLDVSHFDTRYVTDMTSMFSECEKLETLDLSNFNTAELTITIYMFYGCKKLATICVGDGWKTDNVTRSEMMFYGCTSLKGCLGTAYDASHVDKAYAHIDGGENDPGYLTDIHSPYVVRSTDGKTLTFYHDGKILSKTGKIYWLNEGDEYPAWLYGSYTTVTTIVFDASFANARPTTTYSWFSGMSKLTTITGIENLNTSEVTDMTYMFIGCTSLTSLDLTGFDTSNVTNMDGMFGNCTSLTAIDLSSFDTRDVTDMGSMFRTCSSLTSLNLSSFNTQNVGYMDYMFSECEKLEVLDLSSFSTARLGSTICMFEGCKKLKTICVGDGWDEDDIIAGASRDMFNGCTSLVGCQGTTYDASHVDKTYAHIDGGASNPGYLSEKGEPYAALSSDETKLTFYYDKLRSTRGTTYDLNTGENRPGWYSKANKIVSVEFTPLFTFARPTSTCDWFNDMSNLVEITGLEYLNTSEVTNMGLMFDKCALLTSIDVSHFDTGKTVDMHLMFSGCSVLKNLDVSHFNTSKVTTMNSMFSGCKALTELDLSGFDTQNVTDMGYMFSSCKALTSLDLSSFDTQAVTTMYHMFDECSTLTDLDLSGFNTQNVTSMAYMFYGCTGLQHLDVSGFNTSNVTNMLSMFGGGFLSSTGCSSLTELDLSSFNTEKVTEMSYMFKACSSLETIYVGDTWTTDAVTSYSSMFSGCTSIVGGKGTTYDASHVDKTYARIDGGESNPGYLTKKIAFLPGDVNGDGLINIADVTATVDIILGKDDAAPYRYDHEAANLNGDNAITIADLTMLVNIILGNQ